MNTITRNGLTSMAFRSCAHVYSIRNTFRLAYRSASVVNIFSIISGASTKRLSPCGSL
ncbi:hypothetical protein Hdeb2414_s0014g00431931 [Helianthus debilis subsp. tardiflorus]